MGSAYQPSGGAPSFPRIAALGGGHGLAAVSRALAGADELTVIVTVADDGGSSGELRRRREGPAVGDLRRSLLALTADEAPLGRAFKRPLTINRLGVHPLGNLVIRSVADAFDSLEQATEWLGEQLGISGRVLPATTEAVSLIGHTADGILYGESAIGAGTSHVELLRFDPARPRVSTAALEAVESADWVVLAPGSLYTSVLAASALPDLTSALNRTPARVLWVSNVESDGRETAGMNALDHLVALRRHRIRTDAVLYDPLAELTFDVDQLAGEGLVAWPRPLLGSRSGVHDPALLRHALSEVFADLAPGRTAAGAFRY